MSTILSKPRTIITARNLCWETPEGSYLFNDLSFKLDQTHVGLVGRNGAGKTTLANLILGLQQPKHGVVESHGKIVFLSQQCDLDGDLTVAELLQVNKKLAALSAIELGSCDELHFEIIGDDWDIRAKISQYLTELGLSQITLDKKISECSGGEQTRLRLAELFLQNPDYIILDEPTNHLDQSARQHLFQAIQKWQGGMLIISHDRESLGHVDSIMEITNNTLKQYGGNFDFYLEQRRIETEANEQAFKTALLKLKASKKSVQSRKEQHDKSKAKGKRIKARDLAAKGRTNKLAVHMASDKHEKTTRRIQAQAARKLGNVSQKITDTKTQLEQLKKLNIKINNPTIPHKKKILAINDLCFSFNERNIISNLNLTIHGPFRLAITGDNGSGKSTLLKLIHQQLQPSNGSVQCYSKKISYLDQSASILISEKTALENFIHHNPEFTPAEAHHFLASFLFRGESAQKKASILSGGEKLRLALACCLHAAEPREVIILDEPTNHMDLDSILCVEQALAAYQGALIVVSHDANFLKNIRILSTLNLSKLS